MEELRRHPRHDSLNLLHFRVLGPGAPYATRGLGRTLNVSESGLLLEVHEPVSAGQEILVTLGLQEDLVELQGRVTHISPSGADARAAGIEFLAVNAAGRATLLRYIEAFLAAPA